MSTDHFLSLPRPFCPTAIFQSPALSSSLKNTNNAEPPVEAVEPVSASSHGDRLPEDKYRFDRPVSPTVIRGIRMFVQHGRSCRAAFEARLADKTSAQGTSFAEARAASSSGAAVASRVRAYKK